MAIEGNARFAVSRSNGATTLEAERTKARESRSRMVPLVPQGAEESVQGSGWDIAYAALYLNSDEAAFVSGVNLRVDGAAGVRRGGAHGDARIALTVHDDPHKFAAAVAALLTSERLWRRRSDAALRHARTELSESVLDSRLGTLLGTLAARRCAAGPGGADSCRGRSLK